MHNPCSGDNTLRVPVSSNRERSIFVFADADRIGI